MVPIYKRALGYKPERMKTVHLATSFLLCVAGKHKNLELLNKVSVPKSVESTSGDPYITKNLVQILRDQQPQPISNSITEKELLSLRNHLNTLYNNDGAALAAAFHPYKTYGYDFSSPSGEFLSIHSKNHGNAGALIYMVLSQSKEGIETLKITKEILESVDSPSTALGRPFIPNEEIEYEKPENLLPDEIDIERLSDLSALMLPQTLKLNNLVKNIQIIKPAYALRQLMIGVGSWLLLYLIKISSEDKPIIIADYTNGNNERLRTQARACFARYISNFGNFVSRGVDSGSINISTEEAAALSIIQSETTAESDDLESHFNDFALRIGWAQPRAGNVKHKHFETVPDTLSVLLMSLLTIDEVVTMEEISKRLFESWHLCIGLAAKDHSLLSEAGYNPLDYSADLRLNRECFKNLSIALGLAWEPSDGLVLFRLQSK